MPFVTFLKFTRMSEAVRLIVKEDNTVFKKKVAINDTTDDKVLKQNGAVNARYQAGRESVKHRIPALTAFYG